MKKAFALLAAALAALTAPLSRAEQPYPAKPVHFVVGAAPGGIVDVIARLLAPKLSASWGQPVIVENRAGATGLMATKAVLRSAPDGYTVLVHATAVAVMPSLNADAGYRLEDLVPVIDAASSPDTILAYPGLGATTLKQAIDKARSGKLTYSSPGAGTPPSLSADYLFKVLAKVNVTHVPYQGVAGAVGAGMSGEVQFVTLTAASARPQVKSGKLRPLVVMSSRRIALMPDVPTVAETGLPAFEDQTWVGFFLPAGSPREAVARLNADIGRLLDTPDVRERLAALGFDPVGGSPEQFEAFLKQESAKWARIVKETGAKAY
ncbi:MAG TPA: tripartite tricarboxylate transporter substrate-binding protein [Burkholderiales bacterium]|nr:tripartite tricarboxylate transporter substrate-binding protein [Burkholderiales bacterium]